MKNILSVFAITLCLFGCDMNPSKEARIQKLEMEVEQTLNKINELESSVQTLEVENERLRTRVLELEKR